MPADVETTKMRPFALQCAGIALVSMLSGGAEAQKVTGSGPLRVVPAAASVCPGQGYFFTGQSVQVTGSGFSSGASVEIFFRAQGSVASLLDTVNADSSGGLDAVVALPASVPAPGLAKLDARGVHSGSGLLVLSTLFEILTAPGGDSDGDLVPDACDNCPAAMNGGQEDDDRDGVGNACDTCPLDSQNDADGDGACGDLDPCPFDADDDVDGDQLCADVDNCPADANPSQVDTDGNGIGDACQLAATCADGLDNDSDGLVDFPSDTGCSDAADASEQDPLLPCDDGRDNDADGLIDFVLDGLGDPGCASGTSPAEDPECDDSVDNDGDGEVDWDGVYGTHTPDAGCAGEGSGVTELPEPSVVAGAAWGSLLLMGLGRRRRSRNLSHV